MSTESLPPKRKVAPQFDEALKRTEQQDTTSIAEKVRQMWETLQLATKTEPTVEHYLNLDWTVPYTELPQKAKELIERILTNCDVSTLQIILKLAKKRITDDYQLWCFMKEVQEALGLGDMMYRKRRMEE